MVSESQFEAERSRNQRPHDAVDPESVFESVSVVIPTVRERNFTVESLPDWIDPIIATEEGLNVARNRGIERADGEWIVLVDDDVTFPTRLTAWLIDGMHPLHLAGLEDYWPMDGVLGRFIIFHKSLWKRIGGFDESRPHGGDTDFVVRCRNAGASVIRLPRRLIPHHDAAGEFSTAEHVEWLSYLVRRHPRQMVPKAAKLLLRKLGLLSPNRGEYPDGWESAVWRPPAGGDE
ncbi:glycosyltransferase family 2 protein [Halonotius aquaticus]|uniref:Glycosyltransferase family 2 protein n=1 Tax=Halonotius aquaticus TaxID=2216978 RepID=A0A3A6PNL7_9EURY|nr:glycosyltransferase [Halonotius aquaticus]RJX42022.1 glycosyltransferase family 2 protein [Halonotius aquaticus]